MARWSDQILVYEQPGGVLADFVASLAPLRMASARPRDRPRLAPTVQSVFLGSQLTMGGAHLDNGNGPELWDEGDVSTERMYNAGAWPAMASGRMSMKPIAFVGAMIGDPSMVPAELSALAGDPKFIFYLTPFQFTADKMTLHAAWVQLYGCSDLGPPPNTNGAERPWLQVEQICQAANLVLPPDFYTVGQGTRHVGGDSCFACRTLAKMLGYECKWYILTSIPPTRLRLRALLASPLAGSTCISTRYSSARTPWRSCTASSAATGSCGRAATPASRATLERVRLIMAGGRWQRMDGIHNSNLGLVACL